MRIYFYRIDSNARLFHEDSELTDKKFLDFFFTHLEKNRTGKYPEYPYISPCGKEMNFVQTEHYPILFKHRVGDKLYYGGEKGILFQPENLKFDDFGNLLHPFQKEIWGRISTEILLDPELEWRENSENWDLIWKGKEFHIPKFDPNFKSEIS